MGLELGLGLGQGYRDTVLENGTGDREMDTGHEKGGGYGTGTWDGDTEHGTRRKQKVNGRRLRPVCQSRRETPAVGAEGDTSEKLTTPHYTTTPVRRHVWR